jgi:hypothetical protein
MRANVWRKCIIRSLLQCWNVLQLLLGRPPLDNAGSPQDLGCVGRLSAYAAFVLRSEEAGSSNADPSFTQALFDQRRRFQSGELFGPLLPVASSGGIVVARIVEQGAVGGDHLVAVFPLGE